MKKYSFVIPTYNNKILLKNTLEALNHQEGFGSNDYEVIVIDDGSEDCTYDYIKNVNTNYSMKYTYIQKNELSCRSRTRNAGSKLAEGKYLIFIDSDILVREDYLLELDRCYKMMDEMAVIGTRLNLKNEIPYDYVLDKSVFEKYTFEKVDIDYYEVRHFMFDKISYNSYSEIPPWLKFFSCNAVVPKSYFDKAGGFDEKYKGWGMEDNDLAYRLCNEGLKIIINSKMEVLHQFHANVDNSGIPMDKKVEFQRNIDYFISKFPDAFNMPRESVYDFFSGKNHLECSKDGTEKILIEFDEKIRLKDIKSTVLQMCRRDKVDIEVIDYVEDTDLDVWIQLLKDVKSIPKYYPASKRLKPKNNLLGDKYDE